MTLVVGRNGSRKSSFAEAAELALTGTNLRWSARKAKVWQAGWRSLHHRGARSIQLRLSTYGDAIASTIVRRWDEGALLTDGTATIQREGDLVRPLAEAGLDAALVTHRPFLSYLGAPAQAEQHLHRRARAHRLRYPTKGRPQGYRRRR